MDWFSPPRMASSTCGLEGRHIAAPLQLEAGVIDAAGGIDRQQEVQIDRDLGVAGAPMPRARSRTAPQQPRHAVEPTRDDKSASLSKASSRSARRRRCDRPAHAVWQIARLGWRFGPAALSVAAGLALGACLGAVQRLPGLAVVDSSQRGASTMALFNSGSLLYWWLLLMLVPDLAIRWFR